MKFLKMFACVLTVCILAAISVQADELPRYSRGGGVIHGGNPAFTKAGADTVNLMAASDDPTNNTDPRDGGLEPYYDGDFEDASGYPAWNGWTHNDLTMKTETHWHVSNYNQADPGNHAAWCGDIAFAACDSADATGGYGNHWYEILEFRQTVPNPGTSSRVGVTATLIHDTEVAYDYVYLSYGFENEFYTDLQVWDGAGTVAVSDSVTYLPGDYLDGTDIALYFRFRSDRIWSDEDCFFPTAGACQLDDINVHLENGAFVADYFEDFEHGGDPADLGIWHTVLHSGVGDFARIWTGLEDADPCATSYDPQVAFIDDDIVVPGTGGSDCINWCYGPYGYIVTTTGGLAGPDEHIHNAIESPVMAWPAPKDAGAAVYDGAILAFDVYVHEDLTADAPGTFYTWGVRSADTDGSAGNGVQILARQLWQDRNYVYYGGPEYRRDGDDVTDLMNPGRDEVQVQLTVYELGWIWHWHGDDGYPAPYFDNVTFKVFPVHGPAISAREMDLAQDNFPEQGTIDLSDLGSNHVRFDMANNISLAVHMRNDPGDSVVVKVKPVRVGAYLDRNPRLYYNLDANPLFDPYRTGIPTSGFLVGTAAISIAKSQWTDSWRFDFPDTGFMFPGDVLHYFIEGTDAIGGPGGSDPQTALLPPDTTGFSTGFDDPLGYDPSFTVRALPSIRSSGGGIYWQPEILFVNDFANGGGENKWYTALGHMGLVVGQGMDTYYVNQPSSGVGNGIGGRATDQTLADYTEIIYTSGDLGYSTISNGDYNQDPGDDVGTLKTWLDQGGKGMFLTGDGLASDLAGTGPENLDLLQNYLGVTVVTDDIRPLINNQATPLVMALPGNPVIGGFVQTWVAYGGCPDINTFDGVNVVGTGQRLAEFLDPAGLGGQYGFSAATLNIRNPGPDESRIISLPHDLMFVYSDPDNTSGLRGTRAYLLRDIMGYLADAYFQDPLSPVLPGAPFAVQNFPNPFNPSTTITYSLPTAGHLKLSLYNVRGQLVKTLIDGPRPAGADQTVVWDGSDNLGSSVASGVYFYEARAHGDVRIGKATLLK
ncbi:MAG: FlgD immunoglobulin-like domain containing protein [Candidatus Krumholzibacteriota bacterium]